MRMRIYGLFALVAACSSSSSTSPATAPDAGPGDATDGGLEAEAAPPATAVHRGVTGSSMLVGEVSRVHDATQKAAKHHHDGPRSHVL